MENSIFSKIKMRWAKPKKIIYFGVTYKLKTIIP